MLRDQRPWLILEVSDLVGPDKENRAAGILEFLARFDYSFFRISRHKRLREIDTASLQSFQNVLACPPGGGQAAPVGAGPGGRRTGSCRSRVLACPPGKSPPT